MTIQPLRPDDLQDNQREAALRGAQTHAKAVRSIAVGESTSSASNQLQGLFNSYAPLAYMLPWETLDYVELLATYNPDYSQAVENIKMLANTGHNLYVEGNVRVSRRVKDRLEEKARTIQAPHGGMDGLIEKLLDQGATFGSMCGEYIISDDMTDVIDFVDVNPKTIRFFWEDEHWAPYQKVNGAAIEEAKKKGQKVRSGCIKLNELTFTYFAFDAAPNSPYGTPPFLAALSNIAIQRDMVHNMAQIVKKIGLLGIIDLVVKALPMKPGESQEAYEARAGNYLDAFVEVTQDMVRDGGIVHFDDVEAKTYQVGGNAAGATAIFKQNEELIFSGLKSMPSVQGRSYSTTETYAGVAYEIILRNTAKYQRAAKRLIEKGYWLMATMWGETPAGIKITFNENKTLTRLQNAQAQKVEIDNQASLWALGIILQTDVSQNLGYNEPKTPYDTIEASEYPLKSGNDSTEAVDDIETVSDSAEVTRSKTVEEEEDDEG